MTEPTPSPAPRKNRRLVAAGAGAVVAVALVGGGAFAYTQLNGGGAQPHDVMPASMQAYARVDLDPSAGQKIELFRLLRKVPDAAKEIGDAEDTDLRELIVDDLVAEACDDIDFAKDVEPWLGKRIGVGANLEDEQFLVAAQVTDEDAAREGIDRLAECGGQDIGLAFTQGYALISDQQRTVDDAIEATARGSLGDAPKFADAMDELGEQGVASAWFDAAALADSAAALGLPETETEQLEALEDVGSTALALRVVDSSIELAGVGGTTEATDVEGSGVTDLPGDTVAALSFSGLGDQVGPQFEMFLDELEGFSPFEPEPSELDFESEFEPEFEMDEDTLAQLDPETRRLFEELEAEPLPVLPVDDFSVEGLLQDFEDSTGLAVPEDLATLLGDSITLAVGPANLDTLATSEGPQDLADLDIAVRSRGDGPDVLRVMDRLADLAADAGLDLVTDGSDDGAVLATNGDAAAAVQADGDLGDQASFEAVMPFGADTSQAFYLDAATLLDALRESDPSEIAQYDAFRAVGISSARTGDDRTSFSARIAFSD